MNMFRLVIFRTPPVIYNRRLPSANPMPLIQQAAYKKSHTQL